VPFYALAKNSSHVPQSLPRPLLLVERLQVLKHPIEPALVTGWQRH
jgi:hypothetical protein